MQINRNFDNLVPNYLFAEVASRTNKYMQEHPDKKVIKLGIGDVTLPLAPVVIEAMKKGAEDLAHKDTFKGYPDYEGYAFLREAISNYYAGFGVTVDANEIFVSDGAKSDCGNIGDIFGKDNVVLVTDPVYPVYVDSNIMAGRKIVYANSNRENNFAALPDENVKADIIYLCSPNNPTGSAYTADELKQWVDYAIKNDAIILYDAAYEAFITEDLPRSIFAIEGARKCAIEMCSLSKTAGFTGTCFGFGRFVQVAVTGFVAEIIRKVFETPQLVGGFGLQSQEEGCGQRRFFGVARPDMQVPEFELGSGPVADHEPETGAYPAPCGLGDLLAEVERIGRPLRCRGERFDLIDGLRYIVQDDCQRNRLAAFVFEREHLVRYAVGDPLGRE